MFNQSRDAPCMHITLSSSQMERTFKFRDRMGECEVREEEMGYEREKGRDGGGNKKD